MVKLKDTAGKPIEEIRGGAYYRCFGDSKLASLLSRVQSLIIKNGYQLEGIIKDKMADNLICDLDIFLTDQIIPIGVHLAEKSVIKKSKKIKGKKIEPDFILFTRKEKDQNCYIIELKDGHEFDTKSAEKEKANLLDFLKDNDEAFHYFQTHCKIVGFNATSKADIIKGFKNKINDEMALTGKEFCQLLKIDYDEIIEQRRSDQEENFESFISDFLGIKSVAEAIRKKFR